MKFINARIATLTLKRKLKSDAVFMNSYVLSSDGAFFRERNFPLMYERLRSYERYYKLSELYENEQKELIERVKILKAKISAAKDKNDKILEFMVIIEKYNNFETLTSEILQAFIDKVYIGEKMKVDGHYRQTIEIVYNFVGAIELPEF